jgi:2-amino-4-hydroxy-6-hydroxymethyldihydropteridine diphosphokinase
VDALLGIGSNLGDRLDTLQRAVDLLNAERGIRVSRSSRVFETEPVGGVEQPEFLNAVLEIDTDLEPRDLLAATQRAESALGRTREIRWGPRTIDVDILLIDARTIDDPHLTVPHPRMRERAFVLIPLLDLRPTPVLPDGTDLLRVRLVADGAVRPYAPPLRTEP